MPGQKCRPRFVQCVQPSEMRGLTHHASVHTVVLYRRQSSETPNHVKKHNLQARHVNCDIVEGIDT